MSSEKPPKRVPIDLKVQKVEIVDQESGPQVKELGRVPMHEGPGGIPTANLTDILEVIDKTREEAADESQRRNAARKSFVGGGSAAYGEGYDKVFKPTKPPEKVEWWQIWKKQWWKKPK
jgi:hypothetical protein